MTQLFTRSGAAQASNLTSTTGRPMFRHVESCHRCGGLGGSEAWRHTGWTCFECGGTGKGPVKDDPLYTSEQLAKLVAAADKRAAAKSAKVSAERAARDAERAACDAAWHADNAETIELIRGAFAISPVGSYHHNNLGKALALLNAGRQLFWIDDAAALASEAYERHSRAARSQHFGTIGQRMDVTFEVDFVMTFDPYVYGAGCSYLNVGHTAEGNVVVYKGSHGFEKGESVTAKWTIKEHDYRDDVPQTILARPTFPKDPA